MGKRKSTAAGAKRAKRCHPAEESDELVFEVCRRFLSQTGKSRKGAATAVAKWLDEEQGRPDLKREMVYPLVWEAVRRSFLLLCPPCERYLAQRIADLYGVSGYQEDHETIQVVNVRGPETHASVSAAGADLVLSLAKRLKQGGRDPVHIGLGSGAAAMTVAKRLAHRVRSDSECPGLWLHAMSSGGFSVENPNRDAPVTYFGFFDNALPEMHYVGLFSPTVVRCEDYDAFKKTPGVDRSFELAQQIDIVVTSFAMAGDEHGLLRRFLTLVQAEEELDSLEREHWVGEMQFRPFSATGPVVADHGIRAVTLFELSELVELAQADDKFIVLLSAPCLKCGETRADALRYLLKVPELRAWTHLVTDVRTAADLLR